MADDKPKYLKEDETTEEEIRTRMLNELPDDVDKTEGGVPYDFISPAAIELALAAIMAQRVLEKGFASTAASDVEGEVTDELTKRAEEHGVERKAAEKATGQVTFSGTDGTTIPSGTRVATPADSTTSSVEFDTTEEVSISSGSATANIEAVEAGAKGNVNSDTITIIVTPVNGVSGVTNSSATSGGKDQEDDIDLLDRYLAKVRNPSAGGNKADYVNWVLEVDNVGGVSVVPVKNGPGTVSVAIIDKNQTPASQTLVDTVQDYIAPPYKHKKEAENMNIGGNGTSTDTSLNDDSGDSVKMVYDSNGEGTITHKDIQAFLDEPGIWQIRSIVKVDSTSETADLLEIKIYNVTAGAIAKTKPDGSVDAVTTYSASDLSTSFDNVTQNFYWNGSDDLELRITRKLTDTSTIVWVDYGNYISTFSKHTGEVKAPIGAKVTVEAATSVLINVSVTLTIAEGYDASSVQSLVEQNIESYIKSLAFKDDNDVLYAEVGETIIGTTGVKDYSNLTINGGTSNVTIGEQEVAVKGQVTFN